MPARAISLNRAHHGAAMIDAHSPIHLLVGFAAGVLGVNTYLAVLAFIGAKVVDEVVHTGPHALFRRGEGQSIGNELSDLLLEMGGLAVGEKLRERLLPAPLPTAGFSNFHATLTPNGAFP
jgi:hypothetical protein